MDAQRTPDELTAENELICEKLLGWKASCILGYWFPSDQHAGSIRTPSFTTWAEAGLILDVMAARQLVPGLEHDGLEWICALRDSMVAGASTGPLAVRAAAIEYIKAVKS